MARPYVPLHLHSDYSVLDGASKISELIAIAQENNMPAMALTDHGVMHGALELYQKGKAANVNPIIGVEAYVIDGDPKDRVSKQQYNHLVLLAKDKTGYQNLTRLVSKSHLDGFYYKPRMNWEQVAEHSEGLIALSGCLSGPLSHNILRNNPEVARDKARWLRDVFGEDFYIELMDHGMEGERRVNAELVNIASELGFETVITNDSHFSFPRDQRAHDVLLCLQMGKTLNDPARMRSYGPGFYVKNGDELVESFAYLEETLVNRAIENTLKIAEKCNLELTLNQSILPDYPVPEGMTSEGYLKELVYQHTQDRYGKVTREVEERIEYELGIINHMGFPAYFLIVWDFINYSRKNGIPVGPGRGSAAGSFVAFALGITNIDPIEHNLLFERFLNPERVSMPDIDIDFCIEKRERVIEYVSQRYGRERVSQIITFGTLAARAALKGVARVMDIPFSESDKLAKLIPSTPGTKLKEAIAPETPLGKLYETDDRVREIVDLALQIEGKISNTGVHAAGVVISKDPLDTVVPLMTSKDGNVITQYSMDDVATLGLLKMDFLGLRNLTIIDNSINLIQKHKQTELDLDHVSLADEAVYKLLASGQTDGVFQLESSGMKALVKELKPSCFEDINALVALYRPGPLNSGMVESFVKRKHGKETIHYDHPDLEPLLKPTYGTIVYQEQIMQISQTLAGYSLGQADILRRAMGKKKTEVMDKQRAFFLEGTQQSGKIDETLANKLFDQMTEFAAYCFNRSHSAAYALIAYQTAFLKTHYPVEYLSALLSSVSSDLDKIQLYIVTAKKLGIEVLSPDVNKSDRDFTPDGMAIRFGLASIKNVGEGVVDHIIEVRGDKPFASLEEFCTRVTMKNMNRRTLESLMVVGAFDSLGLSRRQLIHNVENIYNYAARLAERKETGQVSLFAMMGGAASDDAGETSLFSEQLTLVGEPDEYTSAEIQRYEKELLGCYVSSHPLDDMLDKLPLVATAFTKDLRELSDGQTVVLAGLISAMVQKMTKTNKPIRIGVLEDLTGSTEIVAFSDSIEKFADFLAEGQKVVITGKLQFRGDDSISVVVNSIRALDEVKITQLWFNGVPTDVEVIYLRDLLKGVKGEDPVILCWADQTRILVGSQFWVDSQKVQQTLAPQLAEAFNNKIALSLAS